MIIRGIICREIFDSRGEPTIEIEIKTAGGVFRASVPSGKSVSEKEAAVFGFAKAAKSAAYLARRVSGKKFFSQTAFDSALVLLDSTSRKNKLGGNVMLGVSIAFARALAARKRWEVWRSVQKEFFKNAFLAEKNQLLIFANLINGGVHAPESGLDIQEYIAILGGSEKINFRVRKLIQLYRVVGEILKKTQNLANLPIGDEAGYVAKSKNNLEPILVLERAIRRLRLAPFCRVGIDAAASSFRRKNKYYFERKLISREELARQYKNWVQKSPLLFSFEDPLAEDDPDGFRCFLEVVKPRWVVGDDLTATNSRLILSAARQNLINSVIIKPNQIGTVTETCRAIQAAQDEGLRVIVSHRSGETEDNFIIHLAKACAADGVKIGPPARERTTKFNELIRLWG